MVDLASSSVLIGWLVGLLDDTRNFNLPTPSSLKKTEEKCIAFALLKFSTNRRHASNGEECQQTGQSVNPHRNTWKIYRSRDAIPFQANINSLINVGQKLYPWHGYKLPDPRRVAYV